jgi:cell division protein FtsZ
MSEAMETNTNELFSTPMPVLKVLGLGGGGSNAINRMIELGMGGVDFIAANTDHQALENCLAPSKILLGPRVTRGLGAGGKPEVGQAAAEESEREIAAALEGADMVFLTAGMGGGTGTGSIPIAARAARSVGAVTIAIVTTPFSFEMGRRQRNATEGLTELRPHTDTLIAIPNDRLLFVAPRDLPIDLAFRMADDVLRQAVQGITELITEPGLINVDFAHIRHLMKLGGGALMSIGLGEGSTKALQAVDHALHHPLLETVSLEQAAGLIANFTGGDDLSLVEVSDVLNNLHAQLNPQAEIVFGVTHDNSMQGRAQVILVVTGIGAPTLEEVMPGVSISSMSSLPMESATPMPALESSDLSLPSTPVRHPVETLPREFNQASPTNLDLPAFLRRRVRLPNGSPG